MQSLTLLLLNQLRLAICNCLFLSEEKTKSIHTFITLIHSKKQIFNILALNSICYIYFDNNLKLEIRLHRYLVFLYFHDKTTDDMRKKRKKEKRRKMRKESLGSNLVWILFHKLFHCVLYFN